MAPQCVPSYKNIDHNVGALASFRSRCYHNYFYTKLAKFLAKIFEHFANKKFPRHFFEHSYFEHSEVEARVVRVEQYRRSRKVSMNTIIKIDKKVIKKCTLIKRQKDLQNTKGVKKDG